MRLHIRTQTKRATVWISVCAILIAPFYFQKPAEAAGELPELISMSSTQQVSGTGSYASQISDDGRYVSYRSSANNLYGQRQNTQAIYLYDRSVKSTELVTVNNGGQQENGSVGEHYSLSRNGRHVAFTSTATNLHHGGDGQRHVFVRNLDSNATTHISKNNDGSAIHGAQMVSMSADGSVVVFSVSVFPGDIYVYESATNSTQRLALAGRTPMISGDGTRILYEDSMRQAAIFDRTANTVTIASSGITTGSYMVPEGISQDGRYAAFRTPSTECGSNYCLYVRDTLNGSTRKVSTATIADSETNIMDAALSSDGQKIIFSYYGYGLGYDSQVGSYDFTTDESRIISRNSVGTLADGAMYPNDSLSLSSDGTWAVFATNSPNFGLPVIGSDPYSYTNHQVFATSTTDIAIPLSVTSLSLDNNPKSIQQTAVLTATLSKDQSSVSQVEYFVGEDPGTGFGTPMTISSNIAAAQLSQGSDFPAGLYVIYVRAQDTNGIWSSSISTVMDVYNPEGGYAAGSGFINPDGTNANIGDFLPTVSGSRPKATFDFTVKYASASDTTPQGESIFTWGQTCNRPTSECFVVETTALQSLVVPTGSEVATFKGTAKLTLGNQKLGSQNPVKVTVTNGATKSYSLQIYKEGADLTTAAPQYEVQGQLSGGTISIHK